MGEITRLCGYLPLAIGMLARQLHHHPAWTAAGLAAELAAARDRLELMRAENLSVAAAFGLSYAGPDRRPAAAVPPARPAPRPRHRRLRRRRAGRHQPGPRPAAASRRLYDQHLITEPARGRYRLHDLLREHARALAAADDPADSDAAAGRLLDYYLHTALAASQRIPQAR